MFVLNLFQHTSINAQNLVPNWSFETIDSCNFGVNCGSGITRGFAPPWDSPNGTSSDLYNVCSPHPDCGVPSNHNGYQYAHTGNGYAGIVSFDLNGNYREYIQAPLDSSLIAQHNYCVSFYVSLSSVVAVGSNNMGMYFSTNHTDTITTHLFYLTPQLNDTNIISDTTNWTEISWQYIATGGEKYIIIGNFYPNSATDTVPSSSPFWGASYYSIDDVSIIDCTEVGVLEELAIKNNELKLYPNPAKDHLTVSLSIGEGAKTVRLYNMLGEQIFTSSFNGLQTIIDVGDLTNGVYFVEVQNEKGVMRKKFVKQ